MTRASSNKNLSPIESEQGRNVPDSDLLAGPTSLVLVDLPFAIDAPSAVSDSARLYAAAAGDAGWRNAQLFASAPDGAPGSYIGQIAAPTIMGTTLGTLDSASPVLIDQVNHIDVEMRNPGMALAYADESQLLAGSNVAVIGGEVIQFAEAVPLGNGQYRLTRLIRGLGGTEAEIARHSANEDFILLDAASMLEIGSAIYPAFSPTTVFALGRDDLAPVSASISTPGRALLPWSPVHPTWNFMDNGDLAIGWTRRSRAGATWSDHVEIPLAEEVEKYRVELSASDGSEVSVLQESATPLTTVPAAQIEPFFINDISDISAQISQVGAHGLSAALVFEIPL